mmetsp:Transcript_110166/g.318437  ORF Transcript_110166/g.318437 Transcript_110166/m.318437 type:complete len:554 (-) Transcript_110166:100-1761(-)
MEMEKPKEQQASNAPPAFATPAPQLSSVEDLERRLQMIGNSSPETAPAAAPVADTKPAAAAAPAATPVKGGKTALLARIMAAKEKSQKAQQQPSTAMKPPPEVDLLGDFDAPGKASDPPPAYDTNFLPPPPASNDSFLPPPPPQEEASSAPPPFDDTMTFSAPPPLNTLAPPPASTSQPTYAMPPPPAASAPDFEDLMSHQHYDQPPPPAPESNLLDMPEAMSPPQPEIDEDILAALDPAEREAILEEQRKIMAQIEKEKDQNNASSAAARAMAFDQRSSAAVAKVAGQYDSAPARRSTATTSSSKKSSSSAASSPGMVNLGHGEQVPLHGQEQTQKAIKDGTALIVQCLNCQNWMQVTKDATLMFCPTCQVVSPVLAEEAATEKDMEAAAQLAADAQLAEKLQAEEYGRASASRSAASRAKSSKPKAAKLEKGQAVEQSWYDWFMGTSTETAKPTPARGSAELPSRSGGGGGGLVAASTGEEAYGRNRSYDESESLMGGGGARMAESKGMFACVADAVGSAVYAMNQDEEGNVHGVDSSGLLAMPNVSRQRD